MKGLTISQLLRLVATALALPSQNHRARQLDGSDRGPEVLAPRDDPWYSAPPNFETTAPGTVLKLRAAPGNLSTITLNSSAAYNILYRTTNSRYKPTWAVTTLFVPDSNVTTTNDQLLSYQIPYDSSYINSSPSYALYAGGQADIADALGRGWHVNVPDYEGPLASFAAGVMSGHATLDSIRAVLRTGFDLRLTNQTRCAMWGYSGGALASEWASELQIQYAPELNIAGAALGGLTPNTSSVRASVNKGPEAGLLPAAILGLASQYPEFEEYLKEALKTEGEFNATGFFNARNLTLLGALATYSNQDISQYFTDGFKALLDPRAQIAINNDGIMGYRGVPRIPLFVYKAIDDETSPVNDTDTLVQRYCGVGATIRYDRNSVGSHGPEVTNGRDRALAFLSSVLNGMYNATGCQIQNVTISADIATAT